MTVVRLPARGRWAWDARGDSRAVRVSPHARENVVNLSVWRDDICVGTVRLVPSEVIALVTGLTEGLAELAERPADAPPQAEGSGDAERLWEMEERLARIESRLMTSRWKAATAAAADWAAGALRSPRLGGRRA